MRTASGQDSAGWMLVKDHTKVREKVMVGVRRGASFPEMSTKGVAPRNKSGCDPNPDVSVPF